MEVARLYSDQVHVLRHGFVPNKPLQAALAELVTTGSSGPRSFPIYGSDERIIPINEAESEQLYQEKYEIMKKMEEKAKYLFRLKTPIELKVGTDAQKKPTTLRLIMNPLETAKYSTVADTLAGMSFGYRGYSPGFTTSSMYTDIPFSELHSADHAKQTVDMMNEKLRDPSMTHLYNVSPLPQLLARTAIRKMHSPETTEQSRAS